MFNWMEAMLETISEVFMFPIFAVVDYKCLQLVAWHVRCRKLIFKFSLRVEITIQFKSESISKLFDFAWMFHLKVHISVPRQLTSSRPSHDGTVRWLEAPWKLVEYKLVQSLLGIFFCFSAPAGIIRSAKNTKIQGGLIRRVEITKRKIKLRT